VASLDPQDLCAAPEGTRHVSVVANEGIGALHSDLLSVDSLDIARSME
jgi:hypothetical protein